MKHFKTLGLLVLAILALVAAFSTVSASASEFTMSKGGLKFNETTLKKHTLYVTGSAAACTNVTFEGQTSGTTSTSEAVIPTFSNCTAFGFAANVTVTTCKLTFGANGTVTLANTHTEPADPCSIHITVDNVFAHCKVTLTEQSIASAVSYSNGPNNDIILKANSAANVSDHVTESTGLCPLTAGTHTNAHWEGESALEAVGGTITFDV
jgi:hypothetical protein